MTFSRHRTCFTITTFALVVACSGPDAGSTEPEASSSPSGFTAPTPTDPAGAVVPPGGALPTDAMPPLAPGDVPAAVPSDPGAALPPPTTPGAPPVAATPTPPLDPGAPVPGVAGAPAVVDTPVDAPVDVAPEPASDVAFSVPSQTFEGELSVTITAGAGAEIRYTTDGSLPTDASPLYDGAPLVLSETTQVRALSFTAGVPGLPNSAIYVARTFDVESDIPIVIMEGYAGGRPQKETAGFGGDAEEPPPPQELIDLGFMVFEPVDGVARISDVPVLATRAGYRERGQSSAGAEKSPYKVEFWDEYDADFDRPVLGMPEESDWAMIGEAFDPTQIQNSLVYDWGAKMGLATVRLRFVELYINFDGGPIEPTDYFGLYALTETIKNQKNRLDLKQLDETVTTMPEITGGYIFKFDQAALDDGETELMCTGSEPLARGGMDETATCWNDLGLVDPEVLNAEQVAYLEPHVQAFHDALHQSPIGDYGAYIDVPSFVDHTIIGELTRNVDAYVRSHYFHKDREGLIKAGPLWDYNLAMASFSAGIEGWHYDSQLTGRGNDDWFYVLGNDPAFRALFDARWTELRQSFLSDAAMLQRIEELAAPIANAALRNQERWGEMSTEQEEPAGGMFGGGFGGAIGDWETALADLAAYLPERAAWIDMAVAEGYTMASESTND